MDTRARVSAIDIRGGNFCDFVFAHHIKQGSKFCDFLSVFVHAKPILKMGLLLLKRRFSLKRKEFAPMLSKFLPFRVDSFSEDRQNTPSQF